MAAVIPSTTTYFVNLCDQITEGDAFTQRFGTQIMVKRFRLKCTIRPGTTQAAAACVRMVVLRAQAGSTLGLTFADCNSSSNPIANNAVSRVYYDKVFQTSATAGTAGFPLALNIDVKIGHHQRYSGSGASVTTGDCIFFALISDVATGTAAPVVNAGFWEIWFQP